MIDSRCGLHCTGCEWKNTHGCKGCIETDGNPFHGECPVAVCCQNKGFTHCGECPDIPCELLNQYSNDPEHGDKPAGKRIEQCKEWAKLYPRKMEIDAFGLFVNNMEVMVKFYSEIIGLHTDWKQGEPYAEFKSGGCRLIMYGRKDFEKMTAQKYGYPNGNNGTLEIAFNLNTYDDVDKEYKRLMELGVKEIFPPTTMGWGQRTSYVADPEGNLLEIGSFGK